MKQNELYDRLVSISGVSDFHLDLRQSYSKSYWGRYYPDRKLIRLYALDEDGNVYPDEVLLREGLHELTHHIQYHHVPFWKRERGVMHDSSFYFIYRGMQKDAFGKVVV